MNQALQALLSGYSLNTAEEYRHALREIIQHITLLGLWRAAFFEYASFYGGTALRIFYGLPRYSEDMDFSLTEPDRTFSLSTFLPAVENEMRAFGFEVTSGQKSKPGDRQIESAFIKTGTLQSMLTIGAPAFVTRRLHRNEALKVKIEIDINPPPYSESEIHTLLLPIPFQVRVYSKSSLFAGKIHAILCREWKKRIKGRDFYDFIWFAGMKIPCSLRHLKARMVQTGHWKENDPLDRSVLVELLKKRFESVDFSLAVKDAEPFVRDKSSFELWSPSFFSEIAGRIVTV